MHRLYRTPLADGRLLSEAEAANGRSAAPKRSPGGEWSLRSYLLPRRIRAYGLYASAISDPIEWALPKLECIDSLGKVAAVQ